MRQHLGRLLVISKRHVPTLLDLTDDEAAAIMRDTRRAALAVTRAYKPDGLTIYQNNGVASGQEIPHVHMHVVPAITTTTARFRGEVPSSPTTSALR